MTTSKKYGKAGEDFAIRILLEQGCEILFRNYHSRYGEIDIIAAQSDTILFVEVKARRKNSMVQGTSAVTRSKQRKIIATALHYLQQHPSSLQPRFDVMELTMDAGGAVQDCNYLQGAFDSSAYESQAGF